MKRVINVFLAVLLLPMCIIAQKDTVYKPVKLPPGITAELNVVYTKVKDWEGKMDVYLPPKTDNPTPVLINIHGGSWNHGAKESQTGFFIYFKAGFAVVNIEYHLTHQAPAPAAIEDTRCALRYVIKNAKTWNIDVQKIIVMGSDAGGHLALMAGFLGNDRRFDTNCMDTDNVKVAAIIDRFGITDVRDWGYGQNIKSKSARDWLGDKTKDVLFAQSVSPMTYINKNNPPTFIIHGDEDPTVPYQQSVNLYNKLLSEGVKTQFITVKGGKHGKFSKEKNVEIDNTIMDFLLHLEAFK
jgi:acetyl esterase/lipase